MKISTISKLDALFSDSPVRHYKKGHILIFSGDTSDKFYSVLRGKIKVYDVNYRGDEVIIHKFGTPSYFPMSLVINQTGTEYIYEVEEDTDVKVINSQAVIEFLSKNPPVVLDLFANLYSVLNRVIAKYVLATTKNAKSRLIFAIINEYKKFAELDTYGARVLDISEAELAASSGLSRETVNREMKILKLKNLIVCGRRSLEVVSVNKLEEYLSTHA